MAEVQEQIVCRKCGIAQDKKEFRPHRYTCRLCKNKEKVERNRKNINHVRELRKQYKSKFEIIRRKYNLQSKYGITPEDYKRMLSEQNSKCAICGKDVNEFKRKLAIDHNHITGKVRGLLCIKCNVRLGTLEDKEFCMKATIYLTKEDDSN